MAVVVVGPGAAVVVGEEVVVVTGVAVVVGEEVVVVGTAVVGFAIENITFKV